MSHHAARNIAGDIVISIVTKVRKYNGIGFRKKFNTGRYARNEMFIELNKSLSIINLINLINLIY